MILCHSTSVQKAEKEALKEVKIKQSDAILSKADARKVAAEVNQVKTKKTDAILANADAEKDAAEVNQASALRYFSTF
jgi:hypothetical protein